MLLPDMVINTRTIHLPARLLHTSKRPGIPGRDTRGGASYNQQDWSPMRSQPTNLWSSRGCPQSHSRTRSRPLASPMNQARSPLSAFVTYQ